MIVGLSTTDQLQFNVRIARSVEKWSAKKRERALAEIIRLPRDYWGIDSQYYDAESCPVHVPIDEIMRLERHRTIYKNGHRTKWEYSQLPVKADACASCPGYCERPSPYGLSIRMLLAKANGKLSLPITDREILQHGEGIVR